MKSAWTNRNAQPLFHHVHQPWLSSQGRALTESAWLRTTKGRSSSEPWWSLMAEAVLPLSPFNEENVEVLCKKKAYIANFEYDGVKLAYKALPEAHLSTSHYNAY